MLDRRSAMFVLPAAGALVATVAACSQGAASSDGDAETNPDDLESVTVDLVAPPFVHAHDQVAKGPPRVVKFRMTTQSKTIVVDEAGTTFHAMTFNGSMPGPTMVVHEGDYVELTLVNPADSTLPHNIDFHGATGALGGAALTLVNPGEQATLRFKATRAGVFVYHCAPEGMVAWHVVSGMHGVLMVLPRAGLSDADGNKLTYDKVFTIGEFDLYLPRNGAGGYTTYPTAEEGYADTIEAMRGLVPSHIIFNGGHGAMTGENALKARVGETVLFVHSQANRDTRPHLIGGHGDWVWETGKFANPPQRDLETWFIRGGSAGAALYKFRQPGLYVYLNHNLIEATLLGAAAHVQVEGTWNDTLMKQVSPPGPIPAGA
ncbi:copper-containing nitrite reductase [Brevundimonas sp.]|uniref:copper-containing nitrite reductase n=1 Tax=Brevundimonas sp. TaxID=1871086 RepID=UPI002FCB472A